MIRMLIVVPYRELYDLVQDYARDSEMNEIRLEEWSKYLFPLAT